MLMRALYPLRATSYLVLSVRMHMQVRHTPLACTKHDDRLCALRASTPSGLHGRARHPLGRPTSLALQTRPVPLLDRCARLRCGRGQGYSANARDQMPSYVADLAGAFLTAALLKRFICANAHASSVRAPPFAITSGGTAC